MKKLFLILSVVFCSLIVSANDIVPIPDTSAITFSKVYNDVKEGIAGLATALKAPAEHVYEILVRQQIIYSLIHLIVLLIGLIGLILTWKYILWINTPKADDKNSRVYYDENWAFFPAILGIISIIMFGIGLINIDVIFTGFLNPEYGAIKDIINFIK